MFVDGCIHNTWFLDDIKQLPKLWRAWRANKESLSQLWKGLLKFYTQKFQFNKHVIAIHDLRPCLRSDFDANTNGYFAIQDPFELDRNLGRYVGLNSREESKIRTALRNGRIIFSSPDPQGFPSDLITFQKYLFSPYRLTREDCAKCGKRGHIDLECPDNSPQESKDHVECIDDKGARDDREQGDGKDSAHNDKDASDDREQGDREASDDNEQGDRENLDDRQRLLRSIIATSTRNACVE